MFLFCTDFETEVISAISVHDAISQDVLNTFKQQASLVRIPGHFWESFAVS